jgi:hypothetical protein
MSYLGQAFCLEDVLQVLLQQPRFRPPDALHVHLGDGRACGCMLIQLLRSEKWKDEAKKATFQCTPQRRNSSAQPASPSK